MNHRNVAVACDERDLYLAKVTVHLCAQRLASPLPGVIDSGDEHLQLTDSHHIVSESQLACTLEYQLN